MNEEEIGEMKADIKWIKQELTKLNEKYAPKWVQYPVYVVVAALGWALADRVRELLIPPAQAFINFL